MPATPMFGAADQQNRGYMSPNSQVSLNPGFDAVKPVQDAWMSRLQPQMDQARQAEMARLRAQGLTEDSNAWARSMDTLNRSDVDARNQALLYGTAENNNIFNRGLAQNNQVFGQALQGNQLTLQQRQQMLQEQNNPYVQLGMLSGIGGRDYLSQLGNYNAQTAANNGLINGIGQLGGGMMNQGQSMGGTAGGTLGGLIGGIGNIGGWLSQLFGG